MATISLRKEAAVAAISIAQSRETGSGMRSLHLLVRQLWASLWSSRSNRDPWDSRDENLPLVYGFSAIALAYFVGFGLVYVYAYDDRFLGTVHLLNAIVVVGNLLALRATGSVFAAKSILVFYIAPVTLTILLATGGVENTGIFWFFCFPPWAFFLMGRRYALFAFVLLAIASLGVLGFTTLGYLASPYAPLTVGVFSLSMAALSGFIYLYQHNREALEQAVQQAMLELRDANSQLAGEIAERQRMEEQLRQAQKMEAIGRLAGGVAHDFNNVLTIIAGFVDLIRAHPAAIAEPVRSHLEQVAQAGDRAAALVRPLLAFSRQQPINRVVLDLNRVVADMEQLLPRLLGEDIRVVTVLDPVLGQVRADRVQLDQVLMNLAANARDAMPEGGTLTIRTANVEPDASGVPAATAPQVLLRVEDTGQGMDRETLERLFEPFYTTKEVGQGTGLGLAMVYGIVKQHQGEIYVDSAPGTGSRFEIYLPRVEEDAPVAQELEQAAGLPRGSETVLLVRGYGCWRGRCCGLSATPSWRRPAARRLSPSSPAMIIPLACS